jgi:predicted RNA binding protein YcfA (HicA-like mRNA interferase family)
MKLISGKQLCIIVEKKGWILRKITGSHHIYKHPDFERILSIPVHKNKDLKIGTLKSHRNTIRRRCRK